MVLTLLMIFKLLLNPLEELLDVQLHVITADSSEQKRMQTSWNPTFTMDHTSHAEESWQSRLG